MQSSSQIVTTNKPTSSQCSTLLTWATLVQALKAWRGGYVTRATCGHIKSYLLNSGSHEAGLVTRKLHSHKTRDMQIRDKTWKITSATAPVRVGTIYIKWVLLAYWGYLVQCFKGNVLQKRKKYSLVLPIAIFAYFLVLMFLTYITHLCCYIFCGRGW